MTNDACLTPACERPVLNRGLCRFHYRKALADGNVDEAGSPKRRPAVERYGHQAVEMWETGMLMSEIADKLGTTDVTIRTVLLQKGIENPARHTPHAILKRQLATQHSIEGLRHLDHLPAQEAILQAWTAPNQAPVLRQAAQEEVRRVMPLLARALDRLASRSDE